MTTLILRKENNSENRTGNTIPTYSINIVVDVDVSAGRVLTLITFETQTSVDFLYVSLIQSGLDGTIKHPPTGTSIELASSDP